MAKIKVSMLAAKANKPFFLPRTSVLSEWSFGFLLPLANLQFFQSQFSHSKWDNKRFSSVPE
jgi:hypothetical protein